MTVQMEDCIADVVMLAKTARDLAIRNGFGNMIPNVVDASAAVYVARTIDGGLREIARALDEANIARGLPAPKAADVDPPKRPDCAMPYFGESLKLGLCRCHADMGNDFWFLPVDSCLFKPKV